MHVENQMKEFSVGIIPSEEMAKIETSNFPGLTHPFIHRNEQSLIALLPLGEYAMFAQMDNKIANITERTLTREHLRETIQWRRRSLTTLGLTESAFKPFNMIAAESIDYLGNIECFFQVGESNIFECFNRGALELAVPLHDRDVTIVLRNGGHQ